MKTGTAFVATLLALASFPLLAQQPPLGDQPNSPAAQQNPAGTESAPPSGPAAAGPEVPAVKMSPVNGELVSKLDSKTAKTGDSVVIQTKASAKTADGTEIPKGSKLLGHVIGVQPSGAGENSQVALQFDKLELKDGQNVTIQSQIQSIAPPTGAASASRPAVGGGGMGGGSAMGGASNPNNSSDPNNPSATGASGASRAGGVPQGAGGDPGPASASAGNGGPAAGTVVARTGSIAIRATSIPGVLLANNEPGQQDPRMARTSSILLGAKQDIQLDGGTQVVVGVSAAGGGTK